MKLILYLVICILAKDINANPIAEKNAAKRINLSERIRNGRQLNETLAVNIIGGEEAVTGEIPYIVSIRYTGGNHFCGGSIVSSTSIVTAAHCVIGESASDLSIRYNTLTHASGGILVQVSMLFTHENYDSGVRYDNDIAVLILQSALDLSLVNAKAVQLPVQDQDPPVNAEVNVSGWGRTDESDATICNLLKVVVPIVSREVCDSLYKTPVINYDISENMICAGVVDVGGKDACQNDSGGPLVHDNVLWGVV